MRMGLQVSADRGRYATKVEKLQADARWADEAGLDSVWTPQIPDEFDVMTAATLIGDGHVAHRGRDGHRPPAAAAPDRAGPAGTVEPGRVRRALHARARASRTTGSFRTCSACPTNAAGHDHALLPRRLGPGAARAGDGRGGERAVHHPQPPRRHRHRADARHDRRARPGDAEAGRRAGGRHHPVAGRRAHHRRPTSSRASRRPPRRRAAPRPGSWPASPSASAATTRSTPPWRARTARSARWRRPRTTSS